MGGAGERERLPVEVIRLGNDSSARLLDSECGRAAVAWLAAVDVAPALAGDPARTLVVAGLQVKIGAPERSRVPVDDGSLDRELDQTRANIERLEAQLANQQFLEKARPEVVEQARDRLTAARERLVTLEDAFSRA